MLLKCKGITGDVRFLAAIVSVIFSFIVLFNHQPINNDAIIAYFPSVSAFLESGIHAAKAAYPWPLYPILIGIIVKVTGLSYVNAAFCISTFFNALTVVAFITLVKELTSDKATIITAAIVILAFHSFNTFRADILRGFGYWALLIFSAIYLIRFARSEKWFDAIMWAFCIMLGTLFRIEGVFLICFAPLTLFLISDVTLKHKIVMLIKAYTLNIIIAVFLLIWLLIKSSHSVHQLGRFQEFVQQITHGYQFLIQNISKPIAAIEPTFGQEKSVYVIVIGLLGYFIISLIEVMSWVYSILAIHGLFVKRPDINKNAKRILITFTIFSVIPAFIFYFQCWRIMSARYYVPFCLLLAAWVPFSLVNLYQRGWKKPTGVVLRWLFMLIVLIIFVEGISGVFHIFGTSNAYLTESGLWAKKNIPTTTNIYSNELRILFYANRQAWTVTAHQNNVLPPDQFQQRWHNYDYYLIRQYRNQAAPEVTFLEQNGLQPIKTFSNHKNDQVLIFAAPKKAT